MKLLTKMYVTIYIFLALVFVTENWDLSGYSRGVLELFAGLFLVILFFSKEKEGKLPNKKHRIFAFFMWVELSFLLAWFVFPWWLGVLIFVFGLIIHYRELTQNVTPADPRKES